jgi:hypothetical protein
MVNDTYYIGKLTFCNYTVYRTSKNVVVRSTIFPDHKIPKLHLDFSRWKKHKQIDHALIEDNNQVYLMFSLLELLAVILTTIWWLQDLGGGYW